MMKKLCCALLTMLLILCCASALAEMCEYGIRDGLCEPKWWVDKKNMMHARACFYHVEEKEDMESHVLITPWEACTLDEGGVCTGCGVDYEPDLTQEDYDIMMLESFYAASGGGDDWQVTAKANGSQMTIAFTDELFAFMDEYGRPYTESSMVETEISLVRVNGAWTVTMSEYGPGPWFQRMGQGWLEIGSIVEDGDSASVQITVCETQYTLSTVEGIPADRCKYYTPDSPCEPGWWLDTENKRHARACFYHVEEKEDMNSHVLITPWEDCTPDEGGVCTGCGHDYDTSDEEPSYDDYDMYMMEAFFHYQEMYLTSPVEVTEKDGKLTITFKDDFFTFMDDMGFPYGESAMVGTDLSLAEVGGVWTVEVSEYGAGAWLKRMGMLEIGDVSEGGAEIIIDGVKHTLGGSVGGVDPERCKYYSPDSPCDIIWWVDSKNEQHCRACRNHVEDKEDPYSYVRLTEWTDCTPGEDYICTGCGYDYSPAQGPTEEDYDAYMVEIYYRLLEKNGVPPMDVTVSGDTLTIELGEQFQMMMLEHGIPVTETLLVDTEYTLAQSGGVWTVEVSEYGPGAWLQRMGLISISDVQVSGGKVTADIALDGGAPYTLTVGGISPVIIPGDADGDGETGILDALAILQVAVGWSNAINLEAADVNDSGEVDIMDALLILQYAVGWDVELK